MLTKSRVIDEITSFDRYRYPMDGAIQTIYQGALVCDDATGYAVNGADTAGFKFRGVADQEIVQSEALTDGDNEITLTPSGSKVLVKLPIVSVVNETHKGLSVYVSDNESVDLVAGVANSVLVGVIRIIESANVVWVEI